MKKRAVNKKVEEDRSPAERQEQELFRSEQRDFALRIRDKMKGSAKVSKKTAEQLARNVGKILDREKSESGLSMGALVHDAGIGGVGETSLLATFRISPGAVPSERLLSRMNKTPQKYVNLIEAVSQQTRKDFHTMIVELADGTRFDEISTEDDSGSAFRVIAEFVQVKVNEISKKYRVKEYFRESVSRKAYLTETGWKANSSAGASPPAPSVPLCSIVEDIKPGKIFYEDGSSKDASIFLVNSLHLVISDVSNKELKAFIGCMPSIGICEQTGFTSRPMYSQQKLPENNPGKNGMLEPERVGGQGIIIFKELDGTNIWQKIENSSENDEVPVGTSEFHESIPDVSEDTLDGELDRKVVGYELAEKIFTGDEHDSRSFLKSFDSRSLRRYFGGTMHYMSGGDLFVENNTDVITEALPRTTLETLEANLFHYEEIVRWLFEETGDPRIEEFGNRGNFLDVLDAETKELVCSFETWVEETVSSAKEKNRMMLDRLIEKSTLH